MLLFIYLFQLIANQILVNNQTLAQQLATGKVQVATINGQQVLIRPTGNNQAQVVAQLTPSTICSTQLQTTQTATTPQSTASPVKTLPSKQIEETTKPSQLQENNASNQIDKNTMEQLLVGQPPGTVIKCVTAQVIQTQQGPRIVLQGLQGADFTQQQLATVQQQVKQQLLKGDFECLCVYLKALILTVPFFVAQASTGRQGVLGPTKIYLAVQPSTNAEQVETATPTNPPPLAPVQSVITQSTIQTAVQPVQNATAAVQQVCSATKC